MTHAESKQRRALCQKYKAEGHTNKEVAEHFGIAYETAKTICRGIAPQRPGSNQYKKYTEEENRNYVESFLDDNFSYVGGYVDCEHKVTIRCNKCGNVFERSMVGIRHGDKTICENCRRLETEAKVKAKEAELKEKAIDRQKKKAQRQRDLEADRFVRTRIVECAECGKVFSTRRTNVVCCSSECSKKRANRLSTKRKDKRITKDKRIDKDITVAKLFKRDNGICWICGCKCDMEDYIVTDKTIICGDWYPSIDHIVPVCEGGEDSWENVKLAHRKCNTMRFWLDLHSPRCLAV